jgi:putative transposase
MSSVVMSLLSYGFDTHIVSFSHDHFNSHHWLLPRRWVVERTFGWLSHYRVLSKDYEVLPRNSEAVVYVAIIHLMVRRLAREPTATPP